MQTTKKAPPKPRTLPLHSASDNTDYPPILHHPDLTLSKTNDQPLKDQVVDLHFLQPIASVSNTMPSHSATMSAEAPSTSAGLFYDPWANGQNLEMDNSMSHSQNQDVAASGSSVEVSPSRLTDKGNSRSRHQRAQSQKTMLSKALQKANTAVLLDNAANFEGAMDAYNDACYLLQLVMLRSNGGEDEKLKLQEIVCLPKKCRTARAFVLKLTLPARYLHDTNN